MKSDYFGYKNNFKKYENIKSNLIIEGKIKNPKITIAIPTYRRVELLKEALLSAIKQKDYSNYNIIVVDNDDSENRDVEKMILALNSEKVFYYKNKKNIGIYGNWNRCIELADGEYFSILSDDDWLENNFLIKMSKYLSEYDGVYCEAKIQDYRKNSKKVSKNKIYDCLKKIKKVRKLKLDDFIYNNVNNSFVFNRKDFIKLGGYDEKYYPVSDYAFSAKFCYQNNVVILKEKLYNYRIQINETLNERTGKLFPRISLKLRSEILKELKKESKFYKNLIYTLYLHEKKYMKEFWELNKSVKDRKMKKSEKFLIYYKKIRNAIKNIV